MCSEEDTCVMSGFTQLTKALNVSEHLESIFVVLSHDLQVRLCMAGVAILCCLLVGIRVAWWWYGQTINATVATDAGKKDDDAFETYRPAATWLRSTAVSRDSVATRTRAKKRTQVSE